MQFIAPVSIHSAPSTTTRRIVPARLTVESAIRNAVPLKPPCSYATLTTAKTGLPPKPVALTSNIRSSCLPTPQGSVQVLHETKSSFHEIEELNDDFQIGRFPGAEAISTSLAAAAAVQQLSARCPPPTYQAQSVPRGQPTNTTAQSNLDLYVSNSLIAGRASQVRDVSPCSLGAVQRASNSPRIDRSPEKNYSAASTSTALGYRASLPGYVTSATSSSPSSDYIDQASPSRNREPASAREVSFTREPVCGRQPPRIGRTMVSKSDEMSRTPTRTPSTTSTHRGFESNAEVSKARVRSIDSGSRSLLTRGMSLNSATDRLNLQRRGSNPTGRQSIVVEDDCSEYSDRFLQGYEKGQLLGRGACAVVWLAVPAGSTTSVAIKQVIKGTTGKKRSDTEAARKEVCFGSYFFSTGGEPKFSLDQNPGVAHIAKLLDYVETKRDIWLVMEFGGVSLTRSAYEIKGEFHRGERLYRVNHLPLLESMKHDARVLKSVLRQLFSALCLFADHRIVHSDIKPDNILVEQNARGQIRVRFIDLGSAFTFDCPESLSLATPEYMPHEALEICAAGRNLLGSAASCAPSSQGGSRSSVVSRQTGSTQRAAAALASDPSQKLNKQAQPWSFDMWSLGSILLELSLGSPLWLSFKCRVADDNRPNSAAMGLFAVPGRDPEKIMQRQVDALCQRGLPNVLKNCPGVPIVGDSGPCTGLDLLSRMMAWDPLDRISPQEALRHPWLQES